MVTCRPCPIKETPPWEVEYCHPPPTHWTHVELKPVERAGWHQSMGLIPWTFWYAFFYYESDPSGPQIRRTRYTGCIYGDTRTTKAMWRWSLQKGQKIWFIAFPPGASHWRSHFSKTHTNMKLKSKERPRYKNLEPLLFLLIPMGCKNTSFAFFLLFLNKIFFQPLYSTLKPFELAHARSVLTGHSDSDWHNKISQVMCPPSVISNWTKSRVSKSSAAVAHRYIFWCK